MTPNHKEYQALAQAREIIESRMRRIGAEIIEAYEARIQQLEVAPRDGYVRLSEYRELERTAATLQSRVKTLENTCEASAIEVETLERRLAQCQRMQYARPPSERC